jgi:hypothetical protein
MIPQTRQKRKIDPRETATYAYAPYVLIAISTYGGSVREENVIEMVGVLMKHILHAQDYVSMRHGESGLIEYAPADQTENTWPVWRQRVGIVLMHLARGDKKKFGGEKLIVRKDGMCSLTTAGQEQLLTLWKAFER